MIRRLYSLLLLPFFAAQTVLGQSTQEDREAITRMSNSRATAFNQSDAATIASYFTQDAILMAPGQEAKEGPEAVEAYYQTIFDAYIPELTSHYEEVVISGDLAYGRGEATVTLTPRSGGSATTSTSKYLNILNRQPDGSWKTTHDIWNSNEPLPD